METIRRAVLILTILCLIASGLAGKGLIYASVGLLLLYLGLTFLLDKIDHRGEEK